MKILSLDTSGPVASAAILDDCNILGEYSINHKKTHSQKLMPMMSELLKTLELQPADIDVFAAAIGPGSFTGLRIGIATIKGMAHALGKPVIGVPTLDGLAYNLSNFPTKICPIIDARNENVYTAIFSFSNENLALNMHSKYMAVHIDELINLLKDEETTIFLGDAVYKFENLIRERLGSSSQFAANNILLQRASSVGLAAYNRLASGQVESYMNIAPLYLRVSQAERLCKNDFIDSI